MEEAECKMDIYILKIKKDTVHYKCPYSPRVKSAWKIFIKIMKFILKMTFFVGFEIYTVLAAAKNKL